MHKQKNSPIIRCLACDSVLDAKFINITSSGRAGFVSHRLYPVGFRIYLSGDKPHPLVVINVGGHPNGHMHFLKWETRK